MSYSTCPKPGCGRPSRSGRQPLCVSHVSIEWRAAKRAAAEPCSVEGCTKTAATLDMCRMHYERARVLGAPGEPERRRTGPPPGSVSWADDITYKSAHRRVVRVRGSASEHACVDCSGPAVDWSYDHLCPDERQSESGPFSLNPDRYQSRCRVCHRAFDREARRALVV